MRILYLDPKICLEFEGWKETSQKFYPTCKIGSITRRAIELLLASILKEGSNPRFYHVLRDFTENCYVGAGMK